MRRENVRRPTKTRAYPANLPPFERTWFPFSCKGAAEAQPAGKHTEEERTDAIMSVIGWLQLFVWVTIMYLL